MSQRFVNLRRATPPVRAAHADRHPFSPVYLHVWAEVAESTQPLQHLTSRSGRFVTFWGSHFRPPTGPLCGVTSPNRGHRDLHRGGVGGRAVCIVQPLGHLPALARRAPESNRDANLVPSSPTSSRGRLTRWQSCRQIG